MSIIKKYLKEDLLKHTLNYSQITPAVEDLINRINEITGVEIQDLQFVGEGANGSAYLFVKKGKEYILKVIEDPIDLNTDVLDILMIKPTRNVVKIYDYFLVEDDSEGYDRGNYKYKDYVYKYGVIVMEKVNVNRQDNTNIFGDNADSFKDKFNRSIRKFLHSEQSTNDFKMLKEELSDLQYLVRNQTNRNKVKQMLNSVINLIKKGLIYVDLHMSNFGTDPKSGTLKLIDVDSCMLTNDWARF